jgi:ligand-binding sensor domain-containing protein
MNLRLRARVQLFGTILALCPFHSFAQPDHLTFDRIAIPQGLSQDVVTSITQDNEGFLWFGTEDGLNKYDGYSVRIYTYDPRDSSGLTENAIGSLFTDSRGRVWVTTGLGVNLYDRANDRFRRLSSSSGIGPDQEEGFAITEDRSGTLWIASNRGISRFNEQTQALERRPGDKSDPAYLLGERINCVFAGYDGVLWIGSKSGVFRFDPVRNTCSRTIDSSTHQALPPALSIREDHNHDLWFSCGRWGVYHLDLRSERIERLPQARGGSRYSGRMALPGHIVAAGIELDEHGNLWIGHSGGFDIYNPNTKRFLSVSPVPADPRALAGRVGPIFRDHAGAMWLGTYQGGVNRCDPYRQKFQLVRSEPGNPASLLNNEVLAICEDHDGAIWIGTSRGLDRFDRRRQKFTHFQHSSTDSGSLHSIEVDALLLDHVGNLWVGGTGNEDGGLDRFVPKRNRFIHYPVRSLYESRDSVLWIGKINERDVGEDLVRINLKTGRILRDTLPGEGVWSIYEDSEGVVWLGGQYCCLNYYDPQRAQFSAIPSDPRDLRRLSSGAVRTIYQDPHGTLWLGTWGGGLNSTERGSGLFRRYNEPDGLPSNYVKGILPDDQGNLWISTERGITRFSIVKNTFRNFGPADGLQGDRFLSGSCFRGRDGWMYFGGSNGLNIFHPDSIFDNPNIPPVVITSLRIHDSPVSLPDRGEREVRLTYDQDYFSVEYVALDYTAPSANRYSYMLEGVDHDWVQAGSRRYAAYAHLPPGTYRFVVRGSNNDGVWNSEGASILIRIIPPFWMAWWFKTLVGLAIIGVLGLAYRARVNKLLDMERLRSRIAADLHDDVGSNLSSIAIASQLIARKITLPERERIQLEEIGSTAIHTSDMMKEIVWLLNPHNDSLDDLLLKMKATAASTIHDVEVTFTSPAERLDKRVDLSKKRNLYLMFKEALHNATKHAHAKTIGVKAEFIKGRLILEIRDDGCGFDTSESPRGNGLKNLRKRSEQIGATCVFESHRGSGTVVTIGVDIP